MHISPADLPIAELLKAVTKAGVRFRLMGGQIKVTGQASPKLRPVLNALKGRREELMSILGGDEGQPSIELLDSLGVTSVVPATAQEARALLGELIADSQKVTPPSVQQQRGVWLGCDIETAALPGEEERPAIHLRLRDGLPATNQPRLKEKAGLNPHRSRIRLLQLYGGGQRCVVLDTSQVPIDAVADALLSCTLLIHNAAFELRFLAAAGVELLRFEDTMQAAGLLLGVHRRSLEEAASAYLDIEVPKALQRSDWSAPVLSEGQIAYAALDAILAFQLWRKLRIELHHKGRAAAYELQRDVTQATVRMIQRGITLDLQAHQQQVAKWQAEAAAARQAFIAETHEVPPTTPAETRVFLTKVLPPDVIASWPRTPKSSELSTEGPELRRHIDIQAIRSLLSLNAMTKLVGTFGPELAKKVSTMTGRLHPGFKVASTKAGRFSCSDPNVQQIPKHKAAWFRGCFVAATGKVFVIADYNAMELRAAAEVSDDTAMRADFANGVDLHRRQAAEMLGIPQEEVTKEQRDAAKPICFGTIYGAGQHGLMASAWSGYGLLLTGDDAEASRRAFLGRYPDLAAWMDHNHTQSNEQGYIAIGKLGRVIEAAWESRKLPDMSYDYPRGEDANELFDWIDDGEEWLVRSAPWQTQLKRTLCCNAPIQGACADAAMRALILVDAALSANGIEGGPVLFVHDEIVVEVPEPEAERTRSIVVEGMIQAFAEAFPNAPLNGLVETKVLTAWGPHEGHDTTAGSATGEDDAAALPAAGVPCPANGGGPAVADQGERADGRSPDHREQVDVPAAETGLTAYEPDGTEEPGKSEEELTTAHLARVCDRCRASPCTVFGETTNFCTLQCCQAGAPDSPRARTDMGSPLQEPEGRPTPSTEDRLVARALAKLTKEASRVGKELATLRSDADVLPMAIRIQLNNSIAELDLLSYRLHEETLMRVVRKSNAA